VKGVCLFIFRKLTKQAGYICSLFKKIYRNDDIDIPFASNFKNKIPIGYSKNRNTQLKYLVRKLNLSTMKFEDIQRTINGKW